MLGGSGVCERVACVCGGDGGDDGGVGGGGGLAEGFNT